MTYHTTDKLVQHIAKVAFPDYNGKKYKIKVATEPVNIRHNAYQSGGSRTLYNFVRMDTMKAYGELPFQHPVFDTPIENATSIDLVPGLMCVEHHHFCGKDMGITIKVHPDNAPKLLSDTRKVSKNVKIVLATTRSFKNTYSGKTGIRYKEARKTTGIDIDQWHAAKKFCIKLKYLTKAGAITNAGMNIIQSIRLESLKKNDELNRQEKAVPEVLQTKECSMNATKTTPNVPKNVEMNLKDGKLTITVDLTRNYGDSKSGLTTVIGSTLGNVEIPGADSGIRLGLNVYKMKPKDERKILKAAAKEVKANK
jgi:hypothetical protein